MDSVDTSCKGSRGKSCTGVTEMGLMQGEPGGSVGGAGGGGVLL